MGDIILTENQATSVIQCFMDHFRQDVLNVDLFGYIKTRDMSFTSLRSNDEDVTSFVIEIEKLTDDIYIPFILFYHFDRPSVHVNDVSLIGWSHKAFITDLIKLLKDFGLFEGDSDNVNTNTI